AVIGLRVGLREDDERVRDAAVGDELLAAVQHVLVAVALRSRLHGRRIGAAARLRQRVRGDLLARRERRTQPFLLFLGAGHEDRIAAERLHREDQRRAGASLRNLFDAHADGHARARDAAVLLGKWDAEDAVLRKELLDVLGILALLVDLGRARRDAILDELTDRVANRDLLFRELEVHFVDYRAMPRAWPEMPMRPESRARIATGKPFPSAARRLAAGTTTSSSTSSPVGDPLRPIFLNTCPTRRPFDSAGTMNALTPEARSSAPVRAKTMWI